MLKGIVLLIMQVLGREVVRVVIRAAMKRLAVVTVTVRAGLGVWGFRHDRFKVRKARKVFRWST